MFFYIHKTNKSLFFYQKMKELNDISINILSSSIKEIRYLVSSNANYFIHNESQEHAILSTDAKNWIKSRVRLYHSTS